MPKSFYLDQKQEQSHWIDYLHHPLIEAEHNERAQVNTTIKTLGIGFDYALSKLTMMLFLLSQTMFCF
jgi:hypothetical protein